MLVRPHDYLPTARAHGWAVGAFNAFNLEFVQAIAQAAERTDAPVIIEASQSALAYAGLRVFAEIVHAVAQESPAPIILHLDHGTDPHLVQQAIVSGLYKSVMIDASAYPYEQNVQITRDIVRLAHKRGVWVEAELGAIPGTEDHLQVKDRDQLFTDPAQAHAFVRATGCDALAVSIGTKHGVYKYHGPVKLDYARLSAIAEAVSVPLVLHGASSIPSRLVRQAQNEGIQLQDAQGLSSAQLSTCIKRGISKINTDSDLRIAFTTAVARERAAQPNEVNPRAYLEAGRTAVSQEVQRRIMQFGSANKA